MHLSSKRLLSILLCLAMVLAMLPLAVFAEAATTLYIKPNSNWNEANARFAAYFFGNGDTWVDCTDADGDGVYEVEVPAGYTSVIFCRMNPGVAENNWDNKWNQTSDLTIPTDGTNCYAIDEGSWDSGKWTTYTPGGTVEPPVTEPPVTEPIVTEPVVPGTTEYCLVGWINGADYGCNDDYENVGEYVFVDGTLTATFDSDSYVFVKATDNSKWLLAEEFCTSASCTFVEGAAEKMFVPANQELTFTLVENADGSVTVTYTKASGECAHVYEDTVVAPTCENNGYTIHKCTLCGYSYNDTPVNPIGHNEISDVIAPTCTQEGYTIYTCLNCGASRQWNSTPALGHSYVNGTCSTCGEVDSSYVPTDLDYYLFGYINGADYGIGEDQANLGEYKFVDGKLTAKFNEDSYVAVKTSDNASFYMTNGWVGSATSATLYMFTDPYSASANKLLVPGGQTVHFTLTENWDGNLIISYTTESSDCKHTDHNTDGICTTCGATVEHTFVSGSCTICGVIEEGYNPFTYYLFGYINGANYGCEEDSSNLGEYKFVDGKLTATFAADSYIGVKEVYPYGKYGPEVIGWYMTDGWQGTETTSVTLYKSGDVATADKLFVPGGVELTFTMSKEGNTVVLSYDKSGCTHSYTESVVDATCLENGSKTFTCSKCGYSYTETLYATGHNYVDGSCTACGAKDPNVDGVYYSLVGYINGANYGCEEDHANAGSYKFVNGKLTASFTSDSYVFVKTSDNVKWFLASAYCQDTTCTFVEGGTEKMFVPGGVQLTFTLTENADGSVTVSYTTGSVEPSVKPTLKLKSPTLEFKDMITVNAFFTAENIEDVVEMGMITYSSKVATVSVETAEHRIPGATYIESTGRYVAASQGIHAKYLGDSVYLSVYAKLKDGTYVYTILAPYSPVQYATNQLNNSTDTKLKQLCAAMLNYGAEAQLFFGHNTSALANASLTAEQKALPEAYRADMISAVPAASTAKQGSFANNQGFAKRTPSISFEGAFCINYFFTPNYAPDNGITLYYWNAADYNAVSVLTTANASGSIKLQGSGVGQYNGEISGIAAKDLSEAVYVSAVYTNGGTTWTSGVLGYSIGSYCSSQASKGAAVSNLAMATAVYGYHAKQYFG